MTGEAAGTWTSSDRLLRPIDETELELTRGIDDVVEVSLLPSVRPCHRRP